MKSELPAGWRQARLGDLIEVHHGFAFRGEFFRDEPPGDLLLTPGNFSIGGGFSWANRKYYDGPVDERFVLRDGALLITMTDLSRNSDTLGSPAIVPSSTDGARFLHNQRLGRVKVKSPNLLDTAYLYAALRTSDYRRQIVASATGTTVKHTSPSKIGAALILVPPIDEQERIASVLGALDDKIDSNRRLARLLEQIAQTEFQARFVDFVGVEDLEESELGLIPRGWRVGTLAELADLHKDQVKPSDDPNALFEHFSIPAFDAGNGPAIEEGDAILSAKTTVPGPECVLVSKLNPATKRVWWPQPGDAGMAVCSPEFLVLMPRDDVPTSYLYAVTSSDERFYREVLGHTTGTTGSRQRVKPSDATRCRVVLAPGEMLHSWDSIARPLYDHAHNLSVESRLVTATRDVLLPKLISGQIRVPDTKDPGEVFGPLVDEAA